jgi:hypothetical protein
VAIHIEDCPFFETKQKVRVGENEVEVLPLQPVVWVSVTRAGLSELPPDTPQLLAVLDTGNNHNLAIKEEQLTDWAKLFVTDLPKLAMQARVRSVRGEELIPVYEADVWLHPFPKRTDLPPLNLEVDGGIVCYTKPKGRKSRASSPGPRLPLLGGLALRSQGLRVLLDYRRLRLKIEGPG